MGLSVPPEYVIPLNFNTVVWKRAIKPCLRDGYDNIYYILDFSISMNFLVTNLGSVERLEAVLNSQIRFTHLTKFS